MNTFLRALYVFVVELILAPFQLVALIGLYIYGIVGYMVEFEDDFVEAVKFANNLWVGAKDGVYLIVNYVKTGEVTF
jgi:hypothetical protein